MKHHWLWTSSLCIGFLGSLAEASPKASQDTFSSPGSGFDPFETPKGDFYNGPALSVDPGSVDEPKASGGDTPCHEPAGRPQRKCEFRSQHEPPSQKSKLKRKV